MSTIEEDLDYIVRNAQEWEEHELSRAGPILRTVDQIRLKLKDISIQGDALLRALEHLVTEERT